MEPFGTTGVIPLATGAQTNNTTGAIQLGAYPNRLKAIVADGNATSSGPVYCEIGLLFGQTNSLVTLANGWLRGDANNAGSDAVAWWGDLPLGKGPCTAVLYARNDTGSTFNIAWGIIVEKV